MLKKITWRTPNRMQIETGCKTFDKQCDLLTTGNVWGRVQFSTYVRPYTETECNGIVNAEGHLQDFDLESMRKVGMPEYIIQEVKAAAVTLSVIVYQIRHWVYKNGKKEKVVHGYVMTDASHKHLRSWFTRKTIKSNEVLIAVRPYIAEK